MLKPDVTKIVTLNAQPYNLLAVGNSDHLASVIKFENYYTLPSHPVPTYCTQTSESTLLWNSTTEWTFASETSESTYRWTATTQRTVASQDKDGVDATSRRSKQQHYSRVPLAHILQNFNESCSSSVLFSVFGGVLLALLVVLVVVRRR